MAEVLRTGSSPEDVGRRVGLARARELSRRGPAGDGIEALEHEMARAGFKPAWRARPRGVELVLERCPFESAAAVNAKAVCALHLGLAKGLAEGIGGVEVESLVPKNPHRAGCRLLARKP